MPNCHACEAKKNCAYYKKQILKQKEEIENKTQEDLAKKMKGEKVE